MSSAAGVVLVGVGPGLPWAKTMSLEVRIDQPKAQSHSYGHVRLEQPSPTQSRPPIAGKVPWSLEGMGRVEGPFWGALNTVQIRCQP